MSDMPHQPATRALAVGSAVVVLLIVALGIGALIVAGNTSRSRRSEEVLQREQTILREVCEVVNRQNRVLLEFSDIINNPIPVPAGSSPALAKAITDRNARLVAGAEYAREHTMPVDCREGS